MIFMCLGELKVVLSSASISYRLDSSISQLSLLIQMLSSLLGGSLVQIMPRIFWRRLNLGVYLNGRDVKGDNIPPTDHVVHYCYGKMIDDGQILGAAFLPRPTDSYLSVN